MYYTGNEPQNAMQVAPRERGLVQAALALATENGAACMAMHERLARGTKMHPATEAELADRAAGLLLVTPGTGTQRDRVEGCMAWHEGGLVLLHALGLAACACTVAALVEEWLFRGAEFQRSSLLLMLGALERRVADMRRAVETMP